MVRSAIALIVGAKVKRRGGYGYGYGYGYGAQNKKKRSRKVTTQHEDFPVEVDALMDGQVPESRRARRSA